jgi:hypothetical protein
VADDVVNFGGAECGLKSGQVRHRVCLIFGQFKGFWKTVRNGNFFHWDSEGLWLSFSLAFHPTDYQVAGIRKGVFGKTCLIEELSFGYCLSQKT